MGVRPSSAAGNHAQQQHLGARVGSRRQKTEEWLLNQDVLREMRSCSEQFAGMSIADAERIFVEFARPLIRPALMHLLWRHEFRVDLHEPLRPSTVLEVPR